MGERRFLLQETGKMPSQLQGHDPAAAAAANDKSTRQAASSTTDAEDQYYMTRMREILSGFPNTGPPSYPVQILDHVFMGNQRNADNVELLRRYGISHVLNCAGGRQRGGSGSGTYPKESGIKEVLLIAADDSEDFDIAGRFDEAIRFLDGVRRAKGKALVHCNLGVNRSGALVAAYLLAADQKRTLLEVVNYLKVKRFVVLSNKGFRRQLIQFARTRGRLDPIIRSADASSDGHYEVQNRSRSEEGRRRGGGGGGKGDKMAVGCTIERMVNPDRSRGEKLEDIKVAKSEEGAQDSRRHGGGAGGGGGAIRLPKTGDPSPPPPPPPTEEPCLRERLWTLPRYTGRCERDKPKPASPPPPPPTVEVFVSHHGGGGGGGSSGVRLSSASIAADDRKTAPVTETAADQRSSAKVSAGRQQLEPVYETKSQDDTGSRNASRNATGSGGTATAAGSSSSSSGGGGGRMSAAAESMSAKLTGLLGSLLGGPKGRQPLRSTSYSNVSAPGASSSSSSRSLVSLPPPLGAEERTTSVSSGSLQTSASGTSLSTTRPLRIYTRSSTDTEIYRTRQDTTRQAAGRSGLLLLLPPPRRPTDPKS